MAIIKCSECGKEISDKSKTCVHCGNPLDETKKSKNNKKENKNPNKSNIVVKIILLSILCFYCISAIIFNFVNGTELSGGALFALLLLIFLFTLSIYSIRKNVITLRTLSDKVKKSESNDKPIQRNKIIIGITIGIVGVVIVISILLSVLIGNNTNTNLQYKLKYETSDGNWVIFFDDGTHYREVSGITKATYTFDKNNRKIILKETQKVASDTFQVEIHFDFINTKELRQTAIKVNGIENSINPPVIWKSIEVKK